MDDISRIILFEIEQMKNSFILIGSANIPFLSIIENVEPIFNYNPVEGFINSRVSPGCSNIDKIENIGNSLAKQLFNYKTNEYKMSLNPVSGTAANQIVYNAILEQNDTILIMNLESGGHISHYHYLEKYFSVLSYNVTKDGYIDYQQLDNLCNKYKPKLIIAGASSYPREIHYDTIYQISKKHNAFLLADISHTAIYILNKTHVSPFGFADFITITTHKTTRGPRSGLLFYKNEFQKDIEFSIFPLTQSAPRYTDILAKVIMFKELTNMNIEKYVNKVLTYSKYFSNYMKEKGLKVYTNGTDTHLVILELGCNAKRIQANLMKNKILVDICSVPNGRNNALRFGFLIIAFLKLTITDFISLCNIVYQIICEDSYVNHQELVAKTIKPYSKKLNRYLVNKKLKEEIKVQYLLELDDLYKDKIMSLLLLCNNEFIPPILKRKSTTQDTFDNTKDDSFLYFHSLFKQEFLILLDTQNNLIGFISFKKEHQLNIYKDSPVIYISTVCLNPKYRRLGIGKLMYQEFLSKIHNNEKNAVLFIRTWSTNYNHIKLLENTGFSEYKREKNHRGKNIDTVYYIYNQKNIY